MKLLSIDTSSKFCSVALMLDSEIYSESKEAERQQAQHLLPMINNLLTQQNIQLQQLDGIAFGCGPGSFTGIRLAASVAQGLAFGANLPVIPVSSLHALAQSAFHKFEATCVVPIISAYGGSVYWGVYRPNGSNIMLSVVPDQKSLPSEVILPDEFFMGLGDGWGLFFEDLKAGATQQFSAVNQNKLATASKMQGVPERKTGAYINICEDLSTGTTRQFAAVVEFSKRFSNARDIVCLASLFSKEKYLAPENALPVYLQDADAWKKLLPSQPA